MEIDQPEKDIMKIAGDIIWSPLQLQIMELLEKHGFMTRNDICMHLGCHPISMKKHVDAYYSDAKHCHIPAHTYAHTEYQRRTTVYDNIMGLIQHGIVQKFARPTNARGRPLVFFKLAD